MTSLKGRRVLIIQQRGWGQTIGHPLAKKLQEEGCRLAALTRKQETHDFTVRQSEVRYEHIFSGDSVKHDPAGFLAGDDFSLSEICETLGLTTIWLLVQSLRQHVMSYKDKFYYGFKQNVDDEGIILFVKAVYKNISGIFKVFAPDIVVGPNCVALPQVMLNLYARKHGRPMITVSDSKVRGVNYFTRDPMEETGPLHERFEELQNGAVSPNAERARRYIEETRACFVPVNIDWLHSGLGGFWTNRKMDVKMWLWCIRMLLRRSRGPNSVIGPTLDTFSPRLMLRDHYARRRYARAAMTMPYYDFNRVGQFAYFPLQFQPEATIDVHAARFNNQIETVRQVAMSLPGDLTLVVKDHPVMFGYRPPSYLEKIRRTPNVKLIDFRIPNDQIIKRARLIISPNSTTIAEAAYYGVPAIQLGELGKTRLFPNVFYHSNLSTLPEKIVEILDIELGGPEYDRQLLNFVTAVYDVGFDADYVGVWERKTKDPAQLEMVIDSFVREIRKALGDFQRTETPVC